MAGESTERVDDAPLGLDEPAEPNGPEVDVEEPVIDLLEPDVEPTEQVADVDPAAEPADPSVGADPADLEVLGIRDRVEDLRIGPE